MRVWACLLLLLAGCASPTAPDEMFLDAEHRYAGHAAEAFDQTEQLELSAGPHTLMVSVRSDDGFAVWLNAPAQKEPYSGIMMPGPRNGFAHQGPVHIQQLTFATVAGGAGTWTLSFGCAAACTYTVAVDEGDQVPAVEGWRPQGLVAGTLEDGSESFTFEAGPDGPATLIMSMATQGAISVDFDDAEGERVGGWNFNSIYARNWKYTSLNEDPAPGQWTVHIGCDGECRFAFGVR